jgi:hypothetical protein
VLASSPPRAGRGANAVVATTREATFTVHAWPRPAPEPGYWPSLQRPLTNRAYGMTDPANDLSFAAASLRDYLATRKPYLCSGGGGRGAGECFHRGAGSGLTIAKATDHSPGGASTARVLRHELERQCQHVGTDACAWMQAPGTGRARSRSLLHCRRPSSGRDAAASCFTAGRAAVEACDWASPPAGATGGGATGGGQSVSPAVAEMVGWRRDRTASMISLGSIPCK